MADSKIPGSIIGVQIGSTWLDCQAEATLNIINNVSEDSPCKVLDGTAGSGKAPWITRTSDSRDWNVSVNGSLLRDSLVAANAAVNLAGLIISGDTSIEVLSFRTAEDQDQSDVDVVYSGPAILTGFTWTAPATGANTTSATFAGNGALTETLTAVTPAPVTP